MQTHNIKDVRKLNSVHEGHFVGFRTPDGSPELNKHGAPRISVYEAPSEVVIKIPTVGEERPVDPIVVYPEFIGHKIAKIYMNNIDYKKELIDKILQPIYGRALIFNEGHTFDMYKKAESIQNLVGNVHNMVREFRTYLGYPCSFYRTEGNKRIPVESHRIINAYKAMKSRSPVRVVEKILYN